MLALIIIAADNAAHLGSIFYVKATAISGQLELHTAVKTDEPPDDFKYLSNQSILETSVFVGCKGIS